MKNYKIENNRVVLDDIPKKTKKMTATRFATCLGLNAWSTPFEAWCEITKTYEKPFEDTIYTLAGKVIEPKVAEYLKNVYFMDIKTPTDVYGENYFNKTYGDFFPKEKIFGGMWDFLGDTFVVEVKTTKRVEDWYNNGTPKAPIYYELQASLYAYLLGFDNVVMTCSFLKDEDYKHPELFEVNADNTVVFEFKLSERFPEFEKYINKAVSFWKQHVETGVSPSFDEKKDAEIIKVLKTAIADIDDEEISKLMKEGDLLKSEIDEVKKTIEDKESRLKEIDDCIKKYLLKQFNESDNKVESTGFKYKWTLSKSTRNSLDSTTFKKEQPDLYNKYIKSTDVYTLKKEEINK